VTPSSSTRSGRTISDMGCLVPQPFAAGENQSYPDLWAITGSPWDPGYKTPTLLFGRCLLGPDGDIAPPNTCLKPPWHASSTKPLWLSSARRQALSSDPVHGTTHASKLSPAVTKAVARASKWASSDLAMAYHMLSIPVLPHCHGRYSTRWQGLTRSW
jgi:hypothetical protein